MNIILIRRTQATFSANIRGEIRPGKMAASVVVRRKNCDNVTWALVRHFGSVMIMLKVIFWTEYSIEICNIKACLFLYKKLTFF